MVINKRKQKWIMTAVLVVSLALIVLFFLGGGNLQLLKDLVSSDVSTDEMRDHLKELGYRGYVTIGILSMLQVVCTVLPAEPVQVLGGLAFGFPIGLACCTVGVFVGNTLIYGMYRCFGDKLRDYFVKNLTFDLEKAANSARVVMVVFLLYFLPAIPYGMICFFAAGVGMKYHRYILVTLLGSIPSICIGVGLGHMTLSASWILSLCVFAVLVVLIVLMYWKRDALFAKLNAFADRPPYSSKTVVQRCSRWLLLPLYCVVRFYFYLCGIRVRTVNKLDHQPEKPSIVLCNHGSFIDFVYSERLLLKSNPNYVAARLYFYHKFLGKLIRKLGAFPKSMFALDVESTKNCMRVLKNGDMLAMMPEARLSTAGFFEDIQPGTYSFLKKADVPVYTIHFNGDYLADPKWGRGMRRGAVVEAELDQLFTVEQLRSLSLEEIRQAVERRLYYDEYAWLETQPKLRYRSRKIAEGLENILTTCPKCGRKFCLTTKKNQISCEHCGPLTKMDGRYSFDPEFQFRNPGQWYRWQMEQLKQEILENPNYCLESKVELRLSSKNGKALTCHGGEGTCTLNRQGLHYHGTQDGETVEKHFSLDKIYRLLFGAGVNFETYQGSEIYFFVPEELRSAVQWYMASMILYDHCRTEK